MVGFDVAADGSIVNVKVLESSGVPELDDAVVACVSTRWHYTPETRDGVPVDSPGHKAVVEFQVR